MEGINCLVLLIYKTPTSMIITTDIRIETITSTAAAAAADFDKITTTRTRLRR